MRYQITATYEVVADTPQEAMRKIARFDANICDRQVLKMTGECKMTATEIYEMQEEGLVQVMK